VLLASHLKHSPSCKDPADRLYSRAFRASAAAAAGAGAAASTSASAVTRLISACSRCFALLSLFDLAH
jgi:hypothetical protein